MSEFIKELLPAQDDFVFSEKLAFNIKQTNQNIIVFEKIDKSKYI